MQALHDTATTRRLTSYADSIVFSAVNCSTYDVRSTFGFLGYHGESVYRRQRHDAQDSLGIELLRFTHNWRRLPVATAAQAWYVVRDSADTRVVHYGQNVRLSRPIGRLAGRILRWQLGRFARAVVSVVTDTEHRSESRDTTCACGNAMAEKEAQ